VKPTLSHVGIYVRDERRMLAFYTDMFKLTVTDTGVGELFPTRLTFLSNNPSQHHQLVLASGRPADQPFSTINQLSFKVATLAELRGMYQRAVAFGVEKLNPINHGNAISIYFDDPEGNKIEVYYETEWYLPQPHRGKIDFSTSDRQILEDTEAMVRADAGMLTRADWEAKIREKMSDDHDG
jgi:catechol 2,3-dioxygenase